jgi:hypothetical protein
MGFLFVYQLAVAACRCGRVVCFLRAFFVQVGATTPHVTGRLIKLTHTWPDFWKLQHSVRPFWFLHASTLIEMWQSYKISWGTSFPGRGSIDFSGSSEGDRRVMITCLTLITSKPRSTSVS